MTDFSKILDKAKELESKMKESQEKIRKIKAEGISGSNSVKVILNGDGEMEKIEILDDVGQRLPRLMLQATRDSWFTFRGKDSSQSNDFRIHNWREMELDEYLFAGGEVVRLWFYPRGPDSGFNVYPGFGKRHTFFDTTSVTHALGEPAWIVRPLPAGTTPPTNGLPTFPLYWETKAPLIWPEMSGALR